MRATSSTLLVRVHTGVTENAGMGNARRSYYSVKDTDDVIYWVTRRIFNEGSEVFLWHSNLITASQSGFLLEHPAGTDSLLMSNQCCSFD